MTEPIPQGRFDLGKLLAAVESAEPVDVIDVLAAELARVLDAAVVSLLVPNFSGDAVVRLSHVVAPAHLADGRNERTESLPLAGSDFERVLFTQDVDVGRVEEGWRVLLPVTERGDAIGVLEVGLEDEPDGEIVDYLRRAAHALAYVLIASRRHTDLFEWAQRDIPFSLAAEIQRRLVPSSYTIESDAFTLAGWLEPAATVGGDTFDYVLGREYLYVSITDAMGHSVQAAMLASLTVGSLRNTRRASASPEAQAEAANAALLAESGDDQFVTGLILRIRLADGRLEIVNSGHPLPYLLRSGETTVLEIEPGPALGVTEAEYVAYVDHLEPGDRLLLVTDGFLERNAMGMDIPRTLESSDERHPREIVRELASHVLGATGGNLRDDATAVCIDWFGMQGRRHAIGGASPGRATAPE